MNEGRKNLSETIHSTGGLRRATRPASVVKSRVFGFVAVVAGGTLLLGWITHTLWNQLDRLQKDHAAVRSESFYLGVHLRGSLRGLNDKLLQFGVSRDRAFRDAFITESAELKDWIATNHILLAQTAKLQLLKSVDVSRQLEILHQVEINYAGYLSNAIPILMATNRPASTRSFESTYQRVREISSGLFPLCDNLVAAQREGFSEFLRGTQGTLISHQRLLMVCSVLILGLAVVLVILVYRGLITPLRLRLSESETIIERQEKLASLGILASGVAHEIRNPLTAIKFRLFSLRKALPAVTQNEDATVIGNEIDRLEQIVRSFLQFARPADPKLTRTQAGVMLQEVHDLLKPQLEKTAIELKLDTPARLFVYADAPQIKQVLINLIQNSAENIGHNGTITLHARRGIVPLDGRMRRAAILAVTDTGQGIPPEIETRLFDPFFTTKDGGTGLGLAVSSRIVERHGGLLRYETELNRGTTFEIVLPALEDDASEHTLD